MLSPVGLALVGALFGILVVIVLRLRGGRAKVLPTPLAPPASLPTGAAAASAEIGEPAQLATDLTAGRTLATERARFGDLQWALPILGQVVQSLSALHDRGVAHGAVKASNVSLSQHSDGSDKATLANAPSSAGTVTGMEADVYAFGVLACEVLAGDRVSQRTVGEISLSESVALDPTVRAMLTRTLSRNPAERPTAGELAWILSSPTSSSFSTSSPDSSR